jgi:hypothetical protein
MSVHHRSAIFRATSFNVRLVSTPVIENSEPNFRKGWKADIRSSRRIVAGAPKAVIHWSFFERPDTTQSWYSH